MTNSPGEYRGCLVLPAGCESAGAMPVLALPSGLAGARLAHPLDVRWAVQGEVFTTVRSALSAAQRQPHTHPQATLGAIAHLQPTAMTARDPLRDAQAQAVAAGGLAA